jgi:outer membrane protein insertion porin family
MVQFFCKPLLILILAPAVLAQAPATPVISSVSFQGNQFVRSSQLRSLLQYSMEGRPYVPAYLSADLQNLEFIYKDKGFLQARVGPPEVQIQKEGNGGTAAIRIPVFEGPVFRVGIITVKNARNFSPETLMQLCPLVKGEPFSRTKASQWQAKIAEAYQSTGYLRFRSILQEHLNDSAKIVDLDLECVEGQPYRVGRILFTGDPSANGTELKRRLLVSEGGVFNPEFLILSLQFINQLRRYKPMSESDVTVTIDDARGIVDLAFRLSLPENTN